jgi:hypothetical protein
MEETSSINPTSRFGSNEKRQALGSIKNNLPRSTNRSSS